jgi:transposase
MSRSAGAAAKLPGKKRKKLAVQALAGSDPISEVSARLGVSRKFIYVQKNKACGALNDASV